MGMMLVKLLAILVGGYSLMTTSRAATESVIYSFKGGVDGDAPYSGLIKVGGLFYGTTLGGGINGFGTVFSVTPGGIKTTIYSFQGGNDGALPQDALIYKDGLLYGVTYSGGNGNCTSGGVSGCGTIFKVTLDGAESLLYTFHGPDGAYPNHALIVVEGVFYGTTILGGAGVCDRDSCGTVFSVTGSGSETVLHSFNGGSDGANPDGGLVYLKGKLYGTTDGGGNNGGYGTAYVTTIGGTETVLHSFSRADGADPVGSLVDVGGVLYGTTANYGAHGYGTTFSITPAGKEVTLQSFQRMVGDDAGGNLIQVGKKLYGTASKGGVDWGSVFEQPLDGGKLKRIYVFKSGTDGNSPNPGLLHVNGVFYGTTFFGGANNHGTVFKLVQ